MVRDRLEELRQKSNRNSKVKDLLIEVEKDPFQNVFNIVQEITKGIDKISENVEYCRRHMKQMSETPFRERELSEKLTEIFLQNGNTTHAVNSTLKQLENKVKNGDKLCALGRIEAVQYNTLRTRFRKCLNENNEELQNFKNFRINTYKAQLRAKGIDVDDEDISELLLSKEDVQIFTDNLLVETAEAKRLLSEAEELNEQLLKIENLIQEVRDLFVQMSVLVEEQQELVDIVEYQTQQAVDFVERIPKVLRKAKENKIKAFKV
ncbi:hypothetical protein WA026_012271 [Henosepilachna vigintioctopunctata]|uniref:t-SNARE coiled-coil homology domain-containing protein n=1 Tax=Henosepilachna vigintioctopunctata TaxID=420089 RepID=A0AAW1VDQ3_9CUCU